MSFLITYYILTLKMTGYRVKSIKCSIIILMARHPLLPLTFLCYSDFFKNIWQSYYILIDGSFGILFRYLWHFEFSVLQAFTWISRINSWQWNSWGKVGCIYNFDKYYLTVIKFFHFSISSHLSSRHCQKAWLLHRSVPPFV